jgi:hypothetical protein
MRYSDTRRLAVITIYSGVVALAYYLDLFGFLMVLSIPWSFPLTISGWLIIHMTSDGEKIITIGYLVGSALNALTYFILSRREEMRVDH